MQTPSAPATASAPCCLFCASHEHHRSYLPSTDFNGKRFDYLECARCHLIYLHPMLDDADYAALYDTSYHDEFYFKRAGSFDRQFQAIERHISGRRLLDYGCGDGEFLRYAHSRGYECVGVEYHPALVKTLRERLPGIRFETIDDLWQDSEQSDFDVIHLGDVFEHLSAPIAVTRDLNGRLKAGGILYAEGPLENNFHLALAARKWHFRRRGPNFVATHRPFHTLMTNAHNQRAAFELAGVQTLQFEVDEWAWPFIANKADAKSRTDLLGFYIARFSMALSFVPGWGNRFFFLGRKPEER